MLDRENMARSFASTTGSRILQGTWPLAVVLLLLTVIAGCTGASQTANPPTTRTPTPATSPAAILPTPTTERNPGPTDGGTASLQATKPTPALEIPSPTPAKEVRSERERNGSPQASAWELRTLAQGNNTFAFDLYRALSDGEGNLFFSPFSISQALAMTLAGAKDETERQMMNTLHYELPQARLHPSFNALDRELASRGRSLQGEESQFFQLNIANAIWGQHGYEFLPDFLAVLAENYGAGLRPLDFARTPEESKVKINDWVSEETQHKIRDLLPPETVDSFTRLVLTNAIYFNASWTWPFDKGLTRERPFHLAEGGGDQDADDVGNLRRLLRLRLGRGLSGGRSALFPGRDVHDNPASR